MKRKNVSVLKCPACGAGGLELSKATEENGVEVRSGKLECSSCKKPFEIRDGIPNLLPPDLHSLVAAEKEGWIVRAKEKKWYDVSDEYLLSLPNPVHSNEEVDWKKASEPF